MRYSGRHECLNSSSVVAVAGFVELVPHCCAGVWGLRGVCDMCGEKTRLGGAVIEKGGVFFFVLSVSHVGNVWTAVWSESWG